MAGEEQFQDYCAEVEEAVDHGQVTHDVMQVLQQIEKVDECLADNQQDEIPDRWHVQAEWWNPEAYKMRKTAAKPQYKYDAQTKTWSPNIDDTSSKPILGPYVPPVKVTHASISPMSSRTSKAKRKTSKCAIM